MSDRHSDILIAQGDTKKVKEQLMGLKGSWNKFLGGWVYPGSRKQEVMDFLRKDPTNVVEEIDGSTEPPAKKPKREKDDFIDDY